MLWWNVFDSPKYKTDPLVAFKGILKVNNLPNAFVSEPEFKLVI